MSVCECFVSIALRSRQSPIYGSLDHRRSLLLIVLNRQGPGSRGLYAHKGRAVHSLPSSGGELETRVQGPHPVLGRSVSVG